MRSWRNFSIAVTLLLLHVIQSIVISPTHWWFVGPDVALLGVLSWSLVLSQSEAIGVSFLAGLFMDVAPPAGGVVGRWALVLTLVAIVLWPIATNERIESPLMSIGLVGLASSVVVVALFLLDSIIGEENMGAAPFLQTVLGVGLWNLLLAPFVLPIIQRLARRQSSVLI